MATSRRRALGFVRGHHSGGEIGIDGHLLAGQGVERKPRRNFGNAPCALGNHHQVDDQQDQEHKQSDGKVAAYQESAESLDHMTGCRAAFMAVNQNDPRRCDIERKA